MCDDLTEAENAAYLERQALSRRQFGMGAGGLAAAGMLGGCAATGEARPATLSERMVSIATPDGTADAFFVHQTGESAPGIVIWPDIAGLRDAFMEMARRLAGEGYAVLAVNQYYRNAPAPVLESFAEWRTPEGQAKIKPMREALSPAATMRDAVAFAGFLDSQDAVDTERRLGSAGFCMGGPMTVLSAAAVPARFGGAASWHGGGLVTDAPDSPHKLLAKTSASYLFGIAQNDDEKQPDAKVKLREACDAATGVTCEIEVYPAQHGWMVIDSPVYNLEQAERGWTRMLALYAKL